MKDILRHEIAAEVAKKGLGFQSSKGAVKQAVGRALFSWAEPHVNIAKDQRGNVVAIKRKGEI